VRRPGGREGAAGLVREEEREGGFIGRRGRGTGAVERLEKKVGEGNEQAKGTMAIRSPGMGRRKRPRGRRSVLPPQRGRGAGGDGRELGWDGGGRGSWFRAVRRVSSASGGMPRSLPNQISSARGTLELIEQRRRGGEMRKRGEGCEAVSRGIGC